MQNIFKKLKIKRRIIAVLAGLHFYGNPSKKLKIIGVTGTNGKTTTATLLYRVATSLGYKCGLIGTVENIIAGEKVEATHTTPDPISLHKLLNTMIEKGCEYVFMEVSSHALDQSRVAGIKFAGGIFTNLTHDHLDYHKNFDNYFGAKKKFFTMLPPRAFALANMDDEYGKKMLEGIKAHPFSYGFQNPKDGLLGQKTVFRENLFQGKIEKMDFNGLALDFNDIKITSKLLGKFNAYNLLAVWSACSLIGFDMDKPARPDDSGHSGGVNKILEKIDPPRGRFEHFTSDSGVLAIVDYAHTPDALEKVLQTIREIKKENSRVISIFGCGGDRDPMKRPVMGKIGALLSDVAIFTSDNSRSEDPDQIIHQMKATLSPEELEKVKSNSDRRQAIQEAVKIAQSGDIILCAGKGHENYQIIKGVTHHFDDMEELKKALEQK